MTKFGAVNTATELKAAIVAEGAHTSNAATYVSGTGTAGSANTNQTVKTQTFVADSLTQLGDRMRIRIYFLLIQRLLLLQQENWGQRDQK